MKPSRILRSSIVPAFTAIAFTFLSSPLPAQDAPSGSRSISRAEYDRLRQEHDAMKKEFAEMKSQLSAVTKMQGSILSPVAAGPASSGKGGAPSSQTQAAIAELQAEIDDLKGKARESFPGTTKFLLAGYGSAGFTALHGHDAVFTASFNPILIWKITDRLIFDGELELELEGSDTNVKLEMAQTSYILNDYMTIGVGKFLNPTNYFVEYQHMSWANKLPDKPLAVYDGLTPETMVGAQLRGAIPIGSMVLNYAAFISNAPSLVIDGDPATVGTLNYDNFDNTDGHIAFGGRISFIPIPQIEIGYGIEHSTVGPRNQSVNLNIQSVDLNIVDDSALLLGLIAFRAQWVWSDVGSFTYDADGSQGFGPLNFSNRRDGGYAQLSYRPTHVDNLWKDIEGVVRYDKLRQHNVPEGIDEQRWTAGLDYWLTPSTVLKLAYQWDSKSNGQPNASGFLLQVATGF